METAITSAMPEDIAPNAIHSGSLSPLRSDEKVQSRYLKPSMASCHDHCKYGKKHDSEAVSPNLITFLKNKRAQIQAAIPNGEERKLKKSSKPKTECEFSDKPDLPKPKSPALTKKAVALTKKSVASGEKKTLLSQDNRQSRGKSTTPHNEKKPKVTKRRTWLQPQASPDKLDGTNLNYPSPAYEGDVSVHHGSIGENTESTTMNLSPSSEADLLVDPGSIEESIESTVSGTSAINLINLSPASESDFSVDSRTSVIDRSPSPEAGLSADPSSVEENIEATANGTIATNSIDPLPASAADAKESTDSSVSPTKIKRKRPPISAVKKLQSTDRKAPLPLKRVDVVAKSTSGLKTKTPLVRTISHLKYSRISIARRNQEKNSTKNLVTLKFGPVTSKPINTSKTTKVPLLRSISNATKSLVALKFGDVASKPMNTSKTRTLLLRSISTRRNQDKASRSTGFSKIGIPGAVKTRNAQGNQESKIIKNLHKSSIMERKVSKPPPTDSASILTLGKLRTVKRSTSLKRKDNVDGPANSKSNENRKFEDSESADIEGISKGGYKRGSRRTSLQDNNNVPAPYKLKFRQGKVIDLRCDSIGARRLWFRVGRMASENPNSNSIAWRRSFRKKDVDRSEFDPPTSGGQTVVLKHQDAEKKKDSQALFNHVIEETASKLVEARKSKVKALVGAFETVISLQETKPGSAV